MNINSLESIISMDIKSTLQTDLHDAIRHGEEIRKSTLRMTLTAIKLAEVEKGTQLDDAACLAVIQKEIKSRRESIADAEKANRPDLIPSWKQRLLFSRVIYLLLSLRKNWRTWLSLP